MKTTNAEIGRAAARGMFGQDSRHRGARSHERTGAHATIILQDDFSGPAGPVSNAWATSTNFALDGAGMR